MQRRWLGLALTLALFDCGYFSMTGTQRPSRYADWRACWLPSFALEPPSAEDLRAFGKDASSRIASDRPGSALLLLHADWAKSAFRTEAYSGEIVLQLAMPLQKGQAQYLDGSGLSAYSEGTLGYGRSSPVQGSAIPMDIKDNHVVFKLDLETLPDHMPIRDTVDAKLTGGTRACFFN
jgi:hypothetical protein